MYFGFGFQIQVLSIVLAAFNLLIQLIIRKLILFLSLIESYFTLFTFVIGFIITIVIGFVMTIVIGLALAIV